ncbi:MAG: hypothetical protein QOK83_03045 [Nitrososphaeraceae archaeon]|nr:hypothetical protein [Nitrososphaeraceae archaeon]
MTPGNGIMICCSTCSMFDYSDHFVNVVGDAEEPICDYRTCRHKLSEHYPSSRICRCSHPSNKAIGIRLSTTAQSTIHL